MILARAEQQAAAFLRALDLDGAVIAGVQRQLLILALEGVAAGGRGGMQDGRQLRQAVGFSGRKPLDGHHHGA